MSGLYLKQQLQQQRISQATLAARLGISRAAMAQLVNHGAWPRRRGDEVKKELACMLAEYGIDTQQAFKSAGEEPGIEEEKMLLKKQILSPQAKKMFGLFRDPFDETTVQNSEDVFTTPDSRYVREAMYQTARYGGMLAVWGESGAGKSTLRRDLISRLQADNSGVLVIEPYVLAMEDNDAAGRTLKIAAITEAILYTLDPACKPKRSPEARFRQLHQALRESARAGFSHVLIIEEAHSLPVPTLKHLKRLLELEDGFKRLLSVILLGQQELRDKLSERNPAVREVVQRCELVQLEPLGVSLEGFIKFKLEKAGKKPAEIIDDSGIAAIQSRLSAKNGSLLYPLAVGNLMISAMNMAAKLGVPVINGDVVLNNNS